MDIKQKSKNLITFKLYILQTIKYDTIKKKFPITCSRGIKRIILLLLRRQSSSEKYRISLVTSKKTWGYAIYLKIYMNQDYVKHLCKTFSYSPEVLESLIHHIEFLEIQVGTRE